MIFFSKQPKKIPHEEKKTHLHRVRSTCNIFFTSYKHFPFREKIFTKFSALTPIPQGVEKETMIPYYVLQKKKKNQIKGNKKNPHPPLPNIILKKIVLFYR